MIQISASSLRNCWTSWMFLLFLRTVFCRLGFSFLSSGMMLIRMKFLGIDGSKFVWSRRDSMCCLSRCSAISFFEMFRSGRSRRRPFFLRVFSFIPPSPLSDPPLTKLSRIVSRLSSPWWAVST